ncbi:MAG: GIY-YIG nuclease family protein [Myxococcaceae bacterium]|nr:MAG: GIY-YIG nuclease family protein [Myxococcaceae bacterium]
MKTTQYIRQEKAWDTRPYLPEDHPDYVTWQREVADDARQMEAQLAVGHLYVVEFISGVVKVGRSGRPDARIAQHAALARVHGGGIHATWVSREHFASSTTERELIEFCARHGRLVAGREYFEIAFSVARSRAALLASNRLGRDDLSVTWLAAHERLTGSSEVAS